MRVSEIRVKQIRVNQGLGVNRKVSRVVQMIKLLADSFVSKYTKTKSARTFTNSVPPVRHILSTAVQDNFLFCP